MVDEHVLKTPLFLFFSSVQSGLLFSSPERKREIPGRQILFSSLLFLHIERREENLFSLSLFSI